jgi:hypothetical protein
MNHARWRIVAAAAIGGCGSATEPEIGPDEVAVPAAEVRAWVDRLDGKWVGDAVLGTGELPFAMDFVAWDPVAGPDPQGEGRYGLAEGFGVSIEFMFDPGDEGWVFTERGAIPGRDVQENTLTPDRLDGTAIEWAHADPDFLWVRGDVTEDVMVFQVLLRGEEHVTITMAPER